MKRLVENFRSDPSEASMRELVAYARTGSPTDGDLAHLATVLASSGAILSVRGSQILADLASTGGPTSLSTLLGPVYLRALGCCVPKLGVAGRPAGGVDVLAQVPGYRVNLTSSEVASCIERCGYAHFVANNEHAPLDARLFDYRRRSGSQNVPELAIVSLLSKKIAVGLQRAGLDIRVAPHGNFGSTWSEAMENGRRFTRVASLVEIEATCFLTDARFPYQPYVGRSESLIALQDVFDAMPNAVLHQHATLCLAMAIATSGAVRPEIDKLVKAAKTSFFENLSAQGGSPESFLEHVHATRKNHKFHITAHDSGFVTIHLDRLRDVITRFQRSDNSTVQFPDNLGVVIRKMPGEIASRHDVLASVRVDQGDWHSIEHELKGVFQVANSLHLSGGFEQVTNG